MNEELIDYLKAYQEWRRGADTEQPDPTELGDRLDEAIQLLSDGCVLSESRAIMNTPELHPDAEALADHVCDVPRLVRHRGSRCGVCYWGLYDGDWCQNKNCEMSGESVGENRIHLTNEEAQILIKANSILEGQS